MVHIFFSFLRERKEVIFLLPPPWWPLSAPQLISFLVFHGDTSHVRFYLCCHIFLSYKLNSKNRIYSFSQLHFLCSPFNASPPRSSTQQHAILFYSRAQHCLSPAKSRFSFPLRPISCYFSIYHYSVYLFPPLLRFALSFSLLSSVHFLSSLFIPGRQYLSRPSLELP